MRQKIYKPGSVWTLQSAMIIPLDHDLQHDSSNRPGHLGRHTPALDASANNAVSLFGFAPDGACRAATVTSRAVRSYRTVSPLPE
jgi:hypothetical protein